MFLKYELNIIITLNKHLTNIEKILSADWAHWHIGTPARITQYIHII